MLKKWAALIRQYEKNNVFAAEAARTIAQNTAFEMCVRRWSTPFSLSFSISRWMRLLVVARESSGDLLFAAVPPLSPFLKKTIQQNEKQVADNHRKAAVRFTLSGFRC